MSGTDVKGVIRIGLDDTDHIDCACTTEHFQRLLTRLNDSIVSFETKERRLVRLWPFAPNRTRGNAALAAICLASTIEMIVAKNVRCSGKKIRVLLTMTLPSQLG